MNAINSCPDTSAGWSAEEELTIATIQQAESVPRAEAIRRMQRRKHVPWRLRFSPKIRPTGRLCRNPRCTRGDDGGPGSLAHLRANALYCDSACKKAGQRSPNRQNRASNRQCLCGSKGDKSSSLAYPHQPEHCLAQNAHNRRFERNGKRMSLPAGKKASRQPVTAGGVGRTKSLIMRPCPTK